MRKMFLILLVLCGMLSSASAQNMRALFLDAPDAVLPMLPRNVRVDCVDFVEAGMSYPVSNVFDGKSVLKTLTDDYLLLQTTGISTVEMKILPFGESFIVCVVNSVSAEATDSRIAFYDRNWEKIDTESYFTAPSINDFLSGADEKIIDMCDIYLVSLKLDADDTSLVAEYTMPDYMNSEDAAKVCSVLRKIVYRWNGIWFAKE